MKVRKINVADARLRRLAHDLRVALEQQPREHVTAVITSSVGDEQQAPEVAPIDPEKYWLHVEFDTRRPSVILPIVGLVQEYSQNLATVTTNMKRRSNHGR